MLNPTTNYVRNGMHVHGPAQPLSSATLANQKKKIRRELESVKVSRSALLSMEGRYLANIIHPNEYLQGVVFGYHDVGFSMLVVTDYRVLFLDRKPLFMNEDEITFDVISGVSLTHSLFWTNVTLHTRIKDYKMLTFNRKAAELFTEYVEYRCLEHSTRERESYD